MALKPAPPKPAADRVRRLNALAALHREWAVARVDTAPFHPDGRKPGSDYNQHYADIEADDDAFHTKARRIMGIGAPAAVKGGSLAGTVREQMLRNYPGHALEWIKDAVWTGPDDAPTDRFDVDDEESWAASHQPKRVNRFARKLRHNPDKVRPIVAVQEPGDQKAVIVDGHHRYLAARKLDRPIKAYIGRVDVEGGPWDNTHAHQIHQGSNPANKAAKDVVAAGLAVRAADTGRVLMLQRHMTDGDPAGGYWEFPGGRLEPGETPVRAAHREWTEETGLTLPTGQQTGSWESKDGIYHGHVHTIPHEAALPILDGRKPGANPDDPDGDETEALAWWDPAALKDNPAVRPEVLHNRKRTVRAIRDGARIGVNKVGPGGWSHGWRRDGIATVARTQREIEDVYGQHNINAEFAKGSYVEQSIHGNIHIDVADKEPDKWHVATNMDKATAARLVDSLDEMLTAASDSHFNDDGDRVDPGHDPVNGMADWQYTDGIMVGYKPNGDIRIGFPGDQPGQLNILDLTHDQAVELNMHLDFMAAD